MDSGNQGTVDESELQCLHNALEANDLVAVNQILDEIGRKTIPSYPSCCSSPLHVVAWHGWAEYVGRLVRSGCKWSTVDEYRWTPLHTAAYRGQSEFLRAYISEMGPINTADECGCTPIMAASRKGHKDIVHFLKEHGGDIHKRDVFGKNSSDYARDAGHEELAQHLHNCSDNRHISSQGQCEVVIVAKNLNDIQDLPLSQFAHGKESPSVHIPGSAVFPVSNRRLHTIGKTNHSRQSLVDFPQPSKPVFLALISVVQMSVLVVLLQEGGISSLNSNPSLGPKPSFVVDFGACESTLIKNGDWWRWISSTFVHAGIFHLVANLIIQWQFCQHLERRYGTRAFGIVYASGGLTGIITSLLLGPNNATLGSSGCIFGTFSMVLVDLMKNWRVIVEPRRVIASYTLILVAAFLLGLIPMVDNFAHIGGYLGGLLVSFLVVKEVPHRRREASPIVKGVIFSIWLAYVIFGFVWIYSKPAGTEICGWCHHINCLPLNEWCERSYI